MNLLSRQDRAASFERSAARRNMLLAIWCIAILIIGLAVGRAIETGSKTALALTAIAVAGSILLAVFASHVNLLYATAFATIPMTQLILPGIGLPVNELMLTLALVVSLVQNRGDLEPLPGYPKVAASVLIGMMTISMMLNGGFELDAFKRLGHIVLFCGVILAIGAGLLPRRVIQKGLLIGIVVSSISGIVFLFAGIAPNGYEGRLTGQLFGDPNPAALAILALGALSIEVVPSGWRRNATIAFLVIPFLLTQSRGSLIALGICLVWWYLGRRLRPSAGLAVLGSTIFLITTVQETVQNIGVFSSRAGSDALRGAILSKSLEAAGTGFWVGNGLGETILTVYTPLDFFFHNSYLAVVAEGGILSAIAIVGLIVMTFIRMINLPTPKRNLWFEMALLAILAAAFHLGEVLLDLPAAVAVGFCLDWLARPEESPRDRIWVPNRRMGQPNRTNWPLATPVP